MPSPDAASDVWPFDHAEVRRIFGDLHRQHFHESDRGLLLLCGSYVDHCLGELLEALMPTELGRKRRRELLDYPGALSTFGARLEVAYAARLIPRPIYDALTALKRIRNRVAHRFEDFSLTESAADISVIYGARHEIPVAVRTFAQKLQAGLHAAAAMKFAEGITDEDGRPLFQSLEEAQEHVSTEPALAKLMSDRLPKFELVLGCTILCASCLSIRDLLRQHLGGSELLGDLLLERSSRSSGDSATTL